jgi:hypothetical protein
MLMAGAVHAQSLGGRSSSDVTPPPLRAPEQFVTIKSLGQFGSAIGPLVNYQGSGFPGYVAPSRLILDRYPTGPNDFTNVQINRTTNFSGGNNINSAFAVLLNAGAADSTQEWGIIANCTTLGAAGGLCVGGDFQGRRIPGATDPIWGSISDAIDSTDLASSAGTGAEILGTEVDVEANKADDAKNPSSFGGVGVRKAIQVAITRKDQTDITPMEVSDALWFSFNGTNTFYDSLVSGAIGTQTRAALDTRALVVPTGIVNPLSAVVMAAGHVIDFKGPPTRTAAPGRPLSYSVTDAALEYSAGSVTFKFNDKGTFTAPLVKTSIYTVASLPTCNSAAEGTRAGVSDATAPSYLGILTGGGTVHSPAYCNGTAWISS